MRRLSVIIYLVLVAPFAFCGFRELPKCSEDSWRLVAELYAFAISYPDDIPDFIERKKDRYIPGGKWQGCAELLASRLSKSALSSASPSQIREEAMAIAKRAGVPKLGPRMAELMMEPDINMMRLASWLRSLSNSVSEIQNGNLSAYHNTEVYQLSTLMWRLMSDLFTPEYNITFQNLMYKLNIWYVLQFAHQV